MNDHSTDSADISWIDIGWSDMSWNEFEGMDIRAANIPILEEGQYFFTPKLDTAISEIDKVKQTIE